MLRQLDSNFKIVRHAFISFGICNLNYDDGSSPIILCHLVENFRDCDQRLAGVLAGAMIGPDGS